ncbi:MAG: winged helix-turn-helix domain-containing protein [Pseudomonadota bacterium]
MSKQPSHEQTHLDWSRHPFDLGPWRVDPTTGRVASNEKEVMLEPRLMALLVLLAQHDGQVLSRDQIEAALWSDVVVGEDTVARTVSRLRRALGDSAKSPEIIETLPKRGYRLIAPVRGIESDDGRSKPLKRGLVPALAAAFALVVVAWFATTYEQDATPDAAADPLVNDIERADDLYMRFTRADNEAAIGLYERVLASAPDNARAQAGMANALVQRVVRWPRGSSSSGVTTLTEALNQGTMSDPQAQAVLSRASAIAERAVRQSPKDPDALKSLAFVYTAQGDLERGVELYERVLTLDGDAWPAMVNLAEIWMMRDEPRQALTYLEDAWSAMSRAYDYEPQRVGPWQVAFGVLIGETYEQLGEIADAELWYRRALSEAPYEPEATVRLAKLLARNGESEEARLLCEALDARIGPYPGCDIQ